jgi:hypothetical protein
MNPATHPFPGFNQGYRFSRQHQIAGCHQPGSAGANDQDIKKIFFHSSGKLMRIELQGSYPAALGDATSIMVRNCCVGSEILVF